MVNTIIKFMPIKAKKSLYISSSELAKKLKISRVAVFKKIQKGQIPAEKIGNSYAIPVEIVDELLHNQRILTEDRKKGINKAVEKVVKEYGETLRLLGKE
jgi:excisionase family DNA binding protein